MKHPDLFGEIDCGPWTKNKGYISVDRANRLFHEWLNKGNVVYGVPNAFFSHVQGEIPMNGGSDTHQAILVCVQGIEQDSADKVLRDLIAQWDRLPVITSVIPEHVELFKRAKRLVGGGG